ncbi:tRNA pseudouridine(38-40) synthase TruA [Spiroplasma sp. DGKH1]|uniref:tRNA pseudouridine(38-40) synthase TruA n=1 Tax=Spiroplasma sp. DGKH1 TaxID=3050074 RepID=UPI0034C5B994
MYLLLTLQYDGYDYHGWVKQKNATTIQGELEKAFFRVSHQQLWMLGASKTDQQVHACDQKVLVKLPFIPKDVGFFIKTVSASLPLDINIKDYEIRDENFGVRNVFEKEYVYTINDGVVDIFNCRYELKYPKPLDVDKLNQIAQVFVGTHDFFNFSGVKKGENINTIRTINKIWVERNDQHKILIHVQAKAFIRYQIRMMVQNILACSEGKISLAEIKTQLANLPGSKKTSFCAKPYGLCLVKITY